VGRVRLGTSGWDYPEWVGPVYPKGLTIDRLAFYARLFPIVEINTTFYRTPRPAVVATWARRTPSAFRFSAKFPRSITHERRLEGGEAELDAFLAAIAPLRDAGRFTAALLQLPPSLPFEPARVRAFYERLPATLAVAVEFREPSWLAPESFALLREFRFAYVVVDEPLLPVRLEVTAPFAYVRWHGHGAPVWYDYAYPPEALDAWVPRVRALAESAPEVYGFFNNHFRGEAVRAGQSLAGRLGLPPPARSGRLPEGDGPGDPAAGTG
jgi:uncharacterized protein YecE (DUF72 family)